MSIARPGPAVARRSFAIALSAALGGCLDRRDETPRHVALVVGQSNYASLPKLANTANDARIVGDALEDAGFSLSSGRVQHDLAKPALESALKLFVRDSVGADSAVFYYAGHGIQIARDNWLVPVDAGPVGFGNVAFAMLNVREWLEVIGQNIPELSVVLLDACRNNPFLQPGIVLESGMAPLITAPRLLVGLSAQPGHAALDGFGGNGPYAPAIMRALRTPHRAAVDILDEVNREVWRVTGGVQEPWRAAGSDVGDRVLV